MRTATRILVVSLTVLLGGCLTFFAPKYSDRGQQMDTSSWEQHCVGRYMVDLPLGAKTTLYTRYYPGGSKGTQFEYMEGVKKEDIPRLVSSRIAELQKERNTAAGTSMFLGKVDFPGGGVGILQWKRRIRTYPKILECYFVAQGGQEYIFRFSHTVFSDEEPNFDPSFCRFVAENLRSREPEEVPAGKGFVVDHGFVTILDYAWSGEPLVESSSLVFSLPDFPIVYFDLTVRNLLGDPTNLLDRVDPDYIMMAYDDKKIIRRGKHNAGDIPGQEICVSGVQDGVVAYECQWGSPGKYKDLANQKLSLTVQVRANEGKGDYPTQEELLRLWDAIIGTIRLRPGAA